MSYSRLDHRSFTVHKLNQSMPSIDVGDAGNQGLGRRSWARVQAWWSSKGRDGGSDRLPVVVDRYVDCDSMLMEYHRRVLFLCLIDGGDHSPEMNDSMADEGIASRSMLAWELDDASDLLCVWWERQRISNMTSMVRRAFQSCCRAPKSSFSTCHRLEMGDEGARMSERGGRLLPLTHKQDPPQIFLLDDQRCEAGRHP